MFWPSKQGGSQQDQTAYELPVPTNRDIFSLAWHKLIAKRINALMRLKPYRGPSDGAIIVADGGSLLPLANDAIGGGGSGTIEEIISLDASVTITNPFGPVADLSVAGAANIIVTSFSAMGYGGNFDYITCGAYQVKLPYLLRFSNASRTAYGTTISYNTYSSSGQSRAAHNGAVSVTQYITPQFNSGDEILIINVGGVFYDLNVDGRVWAGI